MKSEILPLLVLLFLSMIAQGKVSEWMEETYKYMEYTDMRREIYKMAEQYPQIMNVQTSEERFGIKHYQKCGLEVCKLDIVTITDNQRGLSENKPQVFISGTLHGDERIGPHVAFYLIEYLVNNFGQDRQVTRLLQTREIIITPMTNAVGFYHHEREERIDQGHSDFLNN